MLLPLALYAHEASTFRVCDRNQDGLLTEEEYLSRSCGGVIEFGDFDGNQDGSLSEAEYASISRSHSHDGCDPDPNVGCVIVTAPGSPPIWWWPPGGGGYDPNPPGCSLGDPDCDDGGGGGGGGSQEDPDFRACLDHYAIKDEECLFRPEGRMDYDWGQFGTDFSRQFNAYGGFGGLPSGGFPDFGAPVQVYQNIIRGVAQAFWTDQSLSAVNEAYWAGVDVFCIGFPEEAFFAANRADCYQAAYSVSLRLIPSFSNNAFTISQVEIYGVTIRHLPSGNPFANWASNFFTDINDVKVCKLWFDGKDQIPGCV